MKKKFIHKIKIAIILIIVVVPIGYLIFVKNSDNNVSNNYNNQISSNENNKTNISYINLDIENIELNIGQSYKLTTKIDSNNSEDKVVWKSNNNDIVKVDDAGNVTALSSGTAIITVTLEESKIMDSCSIIVKEASIEVNKITLPLEKLTLFVGSKFQMLAIVNPANATNKRLTYNTVSSQIATVTANGEITALKPGSTSIMVMAENNTMATMTLTVISKLAGITPSCPNTSFYLNTTRTSCLEPLYYSACPKGYIYDPKTKRCKDTKDYICEAPGMLTSTGNCMLTEKAAPICQEGVYNSTTKKCITSTSPICSSGIFSPSENKCINGTSACTTGAKYDPATKKCYYDEKAKCPTGYTLQDGECKNIYNKTTSAICDGVDDDYQIIENRTCRMLMEPECTLGTLNNNNGICETGGSSSIKCDNGTYSSTEKKCIESINFTCSNGYIANTNNGTCEKATSTYACPSDYTYNSKTKKCIKTEQATCTDSNHKIKSDGYCSGTNTVTPTCPSGYTFDNGSCND